MEDSMTNRLKRELEGMSWDIVRLVTKKHFKRAQLNADRERAWNWAQDSRRMRYMERKTAEHEAEVVRQFGTYEERLARFNSVFEAKPAIARRYAAVNLSNGSFALSVGG
jgi:hypothetical protein